LGPWPQNQGGRGWPDSPWVSCPPTGGHPVALASADLQVAVAALALLTWPAMTSPCPP
jgi:hypothetical protein